GAAPQRDEAVRRVGVPVAGRRPGDGGAREGLVSEVRGEGVVRVLLGEGRSADRRRGDDGEPPHAPPPMLPRERKTTLPPKGARRKVRRRNAEGRREHTEATGGQVRIFL